MPERPGERTATRVGGRPVADRDDDTAVRTGFAQQLRERLSAAAEEFRAANTGSAPSQRRSSGRSPRRARLRLTRIDPWSVMKTAFLLSIALAVVSIV
jgi:hypothetical protein